MSINDAIYCIEQINSIKASLANLTQHKTKICCEHNVPRLVHTIKIRDVYSLEQMEPRQLAQVMYAIDSYVRKNRKVFEFSHWEHSVIETPVAWEDDYYDYEIDFKIFGYFSDYKTSPEYIKVVDRIEFNQDKLKFWMKQLEGMLK